MSNGNGHRWSKFWWQDWLSDSKLRLCDPASRGVWIDLLCLMHDAGGYLKIDGRRPQPRHIARLLCVRFEQYERCLRTLLEHGVASQTEDGTIYCQRMVKDLGRSETGKANAERRWGAPKPNGSPNGSPNDQPNGHPNARSRSRSTEADTPRSPPQGGQTTRRRNGIQPRDERIVSGGIALMIERVEQLEAEQRRPTPDDDLTDPSSYLRIVAGGRG